MSFFFIGLSKVCLYLLSFHTLICASNRGLCMCMNIDHLVAIPIYSIGNAGGLTALE